MNEIEDEGNLFKIFIQEFVKTSGTRSADLMFDAINPVDILRKLFN